MNAPHLTRKELAQKALFAFQFGCLMLSAGRDAEAAKHFEKLGDYLTRIIDWNE